MFVVDWATLLFCCFYCLTQMLTDFVAVVHVALSKLASLSVICFEGQSSDNGSDTG